MLHRWIAAHADHTPEKIALRFDGQAITYAGLAGRVARMAAALAARGIGHGDRVAFMGANDPAQVILLAACARLGAMQLPLNWRLSTPELRFMLDDSGAALLMATAEFADQARDVAAGLCPIMDAADPGEGETPEESGGAQDPVLLVYTSGTTGRPKGALLDQRALLFNALNSQHMHQFTRDDHVLTVLPLFHVGGLNIQTVPALHAGATVTLHRRFDPAAFFAECEESRPTVTLLVPAVMGALVAHPGWADAALSSLRMIGAGSSDVPLPLIAAFQGRGIPVQQVYGATEASPIAIYQLAEEALAAPGSIGRPAVHCQCRIVDPAGRILPQGQTGEIQIRGPNVLRRYWNAPEATAASLRDGWFATGDVGHVDANGRWWFTDRIKHVIISGGENIYPAEVERVLRSAPGIVEGAVCGRPDARWGEVPVAVVVPAGDFDRAAFLQHFEGRIARFKQPRDVVLVDAMPKTALGKVQLGVLRTLVARGG